MRALIAFDKFKDAITANDACELVAGSLQEVQPTWEVDLCPLTDGGEGFVEILTKAAKGSFAFAEVLGPLNEELTAKYGMVQLQNIPAAARLRLDLPGNLSPEARVAIIEMSAASGLALVPPESRDPWLTSTFGTGRMICAAVESDAEAIVLGVGGSATNDLGLGALSALGLLFTTARAEPLLPPVPASWAAIEQFRGALPTWLPPIRIACDVNNPVLGPNGCAAVYGPQKGLKAEDLPRMEELSGLMGRLLCGHCRKPESLMDTPGAGAAGGIAFGLMAATDARLVPGFALAADWLDLAARIQSADVVLTGEGRFDATSDQGKGPGAVVAAATAAGRPAHVFAGQITARARPEVSFHAITPSNWPLQKALDETHALLRAAIHRHFRDST